MYFWNKANGFVLEVKCEQNHSVKPKAQVILGNKLHTHNAHQQWKLTEDGFIESLLPGGLVLSIKGGVDKSGTKVVVLEKADKAYQKWWVTPEGFIASQLNNLVIDLEGSSKGLGAKAVVKPKNLQSFHQNWNVLHTAVPLFNAVSGLVLTAEGEAKSSPLIVSPLWEIRNAVQLWHITDDFRIISDANGFPLTVDSKGNQTEVVLAPLSNPTAINQKWQVGNGIIVNLNGMVLGTESMQSGSLVVMKPRSEKDDSQRWTTVMPNTQQDQSSVETLPAKQTSVEEEVSPPKAKKAKEDVTKENMEEGEEGMMKWLKRVELFDLLPTLQKLGANDLGSLCYLEADDLQEVPRLRQRKLLSEVKKLRELRGMGSTASLKEGDNV